MSQLAQAAEIKVVSGGAFKQVLNALAVQYRKETGNKLDITYRTVGQHLDLIRGGQEEFDVAILTPEAIDDLAKEGKVVPGTPRRSGKDRRRRRGQGRCAGAGYLDGRCL